MKNKLNRLSAGDIGKIAVKFCKEEDGTYNFQRFESYCERVHDILFEFDERILEMEDGRIEQEIENKKLEQLYD